MKYLVLIGDGMADYPLEALGGKTPLMVARTPNMDALAQRGKVGLVRTIPHGLPKGLLYTEYLTSIENHFIEDQRPSKFK